MRRLGIGTISSMMKLEFLLCGSPTDAFFSQMAFFRLCLKRLVGACRNARMVCVFGDHEEAVVPARWRPWFEDIEVHWAHRPGEANPSHVLQHNMRFELLDPQADVSFICDADVAMVRAPDALAKRLLQDPALAGVIAHVHFPDPSRETRDIEAEWSELAEATIGRPLERPYRYTLLSPDVPHRIPFYINLGVLAGPPSLLRRFHERDLQIRPIVAQRLGHWWAPQVSLALTCADLALPTLALPMRYNFPNDATADGLYPKELEEVVLMHYLREQHFKRGQIFAGSAAFQQFLALKLEGSNHVFQQFVHSATGGAFPFGG